VARLILSLGLTFALLGGVASAGPMPADAVGACAVATTLPEPPKNRPHYAMEIRVAPAMTSVHGTSTVSFAPAVATDRLVFRLWPNSPFSARRGARLTVADVRSAGGPLAVSRPDRTTLVVRRALAARKRITVSMRWTLRLPRSPGVLLHRGRSVRLVSFFPLLAWNGAGWSTEQPVRSDSFWPTSPTADFDVRVFAPARVNVLGSGEQVGKGAWRARAVRDFALALGSFQLVRTTVRAPKPVRITVGLERGSAYDARDFLVSAASALRFYARRFGDYPWSTYSLAVMKDFGGLSGSAYPTLSFLGDRSFVLVPHETAHQWFASLVGNDQSRDPWLSEGLATWAQTGPENSLSLMLGTSIPPRVRNRIGEPMRFWQAYDFETIRRGLYVQSVQALATLGGPSGVDCALRRFVVANAYRTATPGDLLAALEPSFPRAEQTLRARGARF
jgi:Peptidase family M1 domain